MAEIRLNFMLQFAIEVTGRILRLIKIIIYNGPNNALVCNETLIQMSNTKTLKITPTCFDHQLIIIRELYDRGLNHWLKSESSCGVVVRLHTRRHAKRMNVCCRITTHEDSNFNQ
jgi:hypothetical protein